MRFVTPNDQRRPCLPLIIADHPCPGPLNVTCGSAPVAAAEYASLLDHLRQVPDPRRCGVRHVLASILTITAAAGLAGARSFAAVAERIADAPA